MWWLKVNSNDKILALTKFKAFAEDKIIVTQKLIFVLRRVENIVGKGEYAGYQHFLLFLQCFLKLSFLEVSQVRDCVVMGKVNNLSNLQLISSVTTEILYNIKFSHYNDQEHNWDYKNELIFFFFKKDEMINLLYQGLDELKQRNHYKLSHFQGQIISLQLAALSQNLAENFGYVVILDLSY